MNDEGSGDQPRPISDLLRPAEERPLPSRQPTGEERRQHPRYSRCLVGHMLVDDADMPIACVDISQGGVQVVTPGAAAINAGQRATVRIEHGSALYEDEFTVVEANAVGSGTAIHMKLP
jgi:hypothetical protein